LYIFVKLLEKQKFFFLIYIFFQHIYKSSSNNQLNILAFKKDNEIYWLHLFSKNDKENVTTSELKKLKQLSDIMFTLTDEQVKNLVSLGELCEVNTNV
jgi:hypothetical protein